ncbi:MAG: hypothetical protein H6907_20735 [Hyphomicrobiales bacterium]|nr:hypothetical protein [Hyphomicrobiales bacterium]MCP5374169.1 hypothetical protein [Hyphomicrobiales bacterium]
MLIFAKLSAARLAVALAVLLLAAPGAAWAGRYEPDPRIVKVLKDLKPGHSVILGHVKVAGKDIEKWRRNFVHGPYIRDYCLKMPYMADRGTAFYAGANHATPHAFNDAWEFHLASNTWHLLFPPDGGNQLKMFAAQHAIKRNPNDKASADYLRDWYAKNVVLRDGTLQTRNGGPIRPWHTWDGLTYDPRTKRALWAVMHTGERHLRAYAEATGQDPKVLRPQIAPGTGMWMFDFDKGHWIRQTGTKFNPKMRAAGSFLHYIPDLGRSVWFGAEWNDDSGMWSYDSVENRWLNLNPNGRSRFYGVNQDRPGRDLVPPQEMQVAYSAKHRMLVAVRNRGLWIYDVDKNAWSKKIEDPDIFAHDARTVFAYDDRDDLFLLAYPGKGRLHAYSPQTGTWRGLFVHGAGMFTERSAGYYDPEFDVFVLVGSDGRTWVYRYGT